ncbi:MAG: chitobiase/beta-hexosaminidase C-terminal domain-containing protein, partial [Muribaculaceae bacterium]|nr:chitobiase/beta-hexosaminidase C-terminal domain-containing protein [Muribaculaceae bacterium]
FDPTNPPDPQMGYRLTVKTAPEQAGNTTPVRAIYAQADETVYCEAYAHLGYEFRAWMVADSVVSTDRSFYYQMPAEPVVLTAWFDKVDFNPSNPGDPNLNGYNHRVNVYCSPSIAGWVNNNNFLLTEGEETWLYAYPYTGYKFSCWKQDGKIISTERELPIKMGEKNLEYTAQFVFDPANPGEPWPNSWDSATGDLIIDHFEPGYLWDAIYRMTEEDYVSVSNLTVIGKMSPYDLGVVRNLTGLTQADFSRTSGYSYVPSWIFENCEALTKLMLPSSINEIYDWAFYECKNLSELVMYSSMPPTVYYEAFNGVPDNLVVKVYSSSMDLYMNTEPWSNYKIMTIDEDSTALSVTLPDDAADGRYRNVSLQLNNISTGQTQKLVVTGNRTKFIFGNLIPDLKYSLYALAPNGHVIGKELDFVMPQDGWDYKFDSLLQLQEVSLSVMTPDNENVADNTSISWFGEDHTFIGTGSLLTAQVEGDEISYEISLPQELGIEYVLPENGKWAVLADNNDVTVNLTPLTKIEVKGVLTDARLNELLAGAYVTVTQTVNGRYTVSSSATTDANGAYALTVYPAPGTITAGSPEHTEVSLSFNSLDDLKELLNMAMKPISGTELTIALFSHDNVEKGEGANASVPYEDFANVDFKVKNLTKGSDVAYILRYPRMILVAQVDEGDKIEVTATPRNSGFNSASAQTVVADEKGDVKITFTANGDLAAKYADSEAEEVVGLLYDKDGKLYKKESYTDKELRFRNLPDGNYTLVTMMSSKLFSAAGSLAELNSSRLVAEQNYLVSNVVVESGYVSHVDLGTVPTFDETQFYYTGSETSISVNKTSVTVGATVTVRSKVDLLPEYAGKVDKVNIIFTIPEGCDYVDNSLLVAGDGAISSSVEDGRLCVETSLKDASPRFCIIPRKGGDHRPSAMIEFEIDGETISQPIGSTLVTAGDFTISVPQKTSVTKIAARGTATALSEVKVYDNNMFIGSTRTLTNGDWRLKFDLYNPGDYSEHYIYAEITTPEGVKYTTTTGKTIYDKDWAEVTDINMIYGGTRADFDHIEATTTPGSYSYVPGNDMFTFKAIFREGHAEKVKSLDFVILLSDGSRRRIDGKYIKASDAWVCALSFPDVNRLPVNVKVIYVEKRDEELSKARDIEDNLNEAFRCPDIVPIIDPSGYVYEAVPSNRLEGVTATIFYKEWVEDMYGEVSEQVMKWDAEAYAQENPLFTDADGMYAWDVPQGDWQVRFEKEGYEVASTEWLPVPPPQLDVNVGMIQTVRPEVKSARAYSQSVEVEFDKYMNPATLTDANVAVMVNGEAVAGELIMLNAEENLDGESYASVVRFEAEEPFAAEVVTLMISGKVESYAGIRMEEAFTQEFTVEPEVKEIAVPGYINAYVGVEKELTVTIAPAEAVAGKTLYIESSYPILTVSESVTVNEEGQATVKFVGDLPGETALTYKLENSNFEAPSTVISFTVITDPAAAPVASVETESEVEKGTEVELASDTEGAVIWYTLDGTDPLTSETRQQYVEPIVINDETTVNACAQAEGYLDSEVATYHYTVKETSGVDDLYVGSLKVVALASNAGFKVYGVGEEAVVEVYDLTGKAAMAPITIQG